MASAVNCLSYKVLCSLLYKTMSWKGFEWSFNTIQLLSVQREINGLLKIKGKWGKTPVSKQDLGQRKIKEIHFPFLGRHCISERPGIQLPGSEISHSRIVTRLVLLVHILCSFSSLWPWIFISSPTVLFCVFHSIPLKSSVDRASWCLWSFYSALGTLPGTSVFWSIQLAGDEAEIPPKEKNLGLRGRCGEEGTKEMKREKDWRKWRLEGERNGKTRGREKCRRLWKEE